MRGKKDKTFISVMQKTITSYAANVRRTEDILETISESWMLVSNVKSRLWRIDRIMDRCINIIDRNNKYAILYYISEQPGNRHLKYNFKYFYYWFCFNFCQ